MEPSPSVANPSSSWLRVGLPAGIFLVSFLCFTPALGGEFLNWDDNLVLTGHAAWRGLGGDQIRWAFSTFHAGHYHPLTWLSFELDYVLWGMNPRGYHLVNLLLHAATATLFYVVLLRLLERSGRFAGREVVSRLAAAGGALFFAVHPLRVESVAWITERRDVLSGGLLVLTVLAWLTWTAGGGRRWYAIALASFALSLLSKAWGITLPVVLLLMDAYPLGRLRDRRPAALLLEKAPFIVLAVAAGAAAFMAQKQVGAMDIVQGHSGIERVLQAGYGLFFYPAKTVAPLALNPLYALKPDFNPYEAPYLVGAMAAAAVTAVLVLLRRRRPELFAAWAIYAVSVSPVLGLAQAGPQLVADRYSYLSCLPFAVLGAAGLAAWMSRPGAALRIPALGAAIVLAALGVSSWSYSHAWRDSVSLWTRAVRLDAKNAQAWYNLGSAKLDRGDHAEAARDLTLAIGLNPRNASAFINRGVARMRDDVDGAIADFDTAIRLHPESADAFANRGVARLMKRDADAGCSDLSEAIRLDPRHHQARLNRGLARLQRREFAAAKEDLAEAMRLKPEHPDAWYVRGQVRHEEGDFEGAIADYARALSGAPPGWVYQRRAEELLDLARQRKSRR